MAKQEDRIVAPNKKVYGATKRDLISKGYVCYDYGSWCRLHTSDYMHEVILTKGWLQSINGRRTTT